MTRVVRRSARGQLLCLAATLALALALLALPPATGAVPATRPDGTTDVVVGIDAGTGMTVRRVTNERGTMTYYVHRPVGIGAGAPMVVHLHGANMDARDAARKSGLNRLADERGFVAVYPQEAPDNGRLGIWDWGVGARDQVEDRAVSLVADLTRHVRDDEAVDPDRVFLGGISAGAGEAVVVAAVHPDLFRAVHLEVGCMFGCLTGALATPTSASTLDEEVAGRRAFEAMGDRARRVPFLVSYGTLDVNALVAGQEQLVRQWLATNDLVDDGERDHSVPSTPAGTRHGSAGGRTYAVDRYVDARGCTLGERWVIDGLRHAYSGGTPSGPVDPDVEPAGPDMRGVAIDFFLAQTQAQADPDHSTC